MPKQQNLCNYGNWANCLNVVCIYRVWRADVANAQYVAFKWCFKRREDVQKKINRN